MPITLARTLRRRTRVPGPIQRQVAALAPGRSRSPVLRSSWNTAPFDTLLRSASQLPFDMLRARLRMLDCGDSWRSFVVRAEALTRAGASCRLFEAMSHPLEQLVTVSFEGLQDSMLSFVIELGEGWVQRRSGGCLPICRWARRAATLPPAPPIKGGEHRAASTWPDK